MNSGRGKQKKKCKLELRIINRNLYAREVAESNAFIQTY